jgi:hypothetical protein
MATYIYMSFVQAVYYFSIAVLASIELATGLLHHLHYYWAPVTCTWRWMATIETGPRSQLARVLGIDCVQLLCGFLCF